MKKKIIIIVSLLIVLVIGITYAWWNWQSSTNTNVTFNVEGASVTYSAGNNISGIKLIPVSSKEKGVTDNTAVYKEITASSNKTMYLTLNMALTTFPSNLADASLVWEIYKGNTKIGNGNFSGKQQGDSITLFKDQEINSTESLYKLYIWIDGNQDNPNTMMNQDFVFTLNATATDEAPTRLMAQPLYQHNCERGDDAFDPCYGEDYIFDRFDSDDSGLTNILGKTFSYEEYDKINKIYTVSSKTVPANAIDSWDASESQNGGVMAWLVEDTNDNTKYNLYIGQDGGVVANPNSSYLFANYWDATDIDLSNFDTSNVINMRSMFIGNYNLNTLNLGLNFDTSNVTDMSGMFNQITITSLNLGNKFDTSNVTSMYGMFGISNFATLNLGNNFDTSNVTNMSYMFDDLGSLTTLNLGNKFDTSNVTDMSYMFSGMSALTTLNLGSNFDTSNVTDMSWMFGYMEELDSLDLGSKFDTSNVTRMYSMFRNMISLTTLNLGSNFDTSNVMTMNDMFFNDSALTTIYTSLDFVIGNLSPLYSYSMFVNCTNLVGGNNTVYNRAHAEASYAKIDRPGTPGYFTDIAVLNS